MPKVVRWPASDHTGRFNAPVGTGSILTFLMALESVEYVIQVPILCYICNYSEFL